MSVFDANLLVWSHDISLRTFVEVYGKSHLTQLVRTTSGYSDDDSVNDIASEERVMAKSATGEHVSIPRSYDLKFQKLSGSLAGPGLPVSLDDLVRESRFKGQTIQLADANAPIHNFSASASSVCRNLLSQLKLKDVYNEKYLLARSVLYSGEMSDIVHGIPAYLPITVQVARGIKDDTTGRAFMEWSQQLADVSSAFPSQTTGVMCEDILVFDDLRTNDYEFVNPSCNATRYTNWKQTTLPKEQPQRFSATSDDSSDVNLYDDARSLIAELHQDQAFSAPSVQQTHSGKQVSILKPDTFSPLPVAAKPILPARRPADGIYSNLPNLTEYAIKPRPNYEDDDDDDCDYEEIPETYPRSAPAATERFASACLNFGSKSEPGRRKSFDAISVPVSKKAQIGTAAQVSGVHYGVPQPASYSSPSNTSLPPQTYSNNQTTDPTRPSVTGFVFSDENKSIKSSEPVCLLPEPLADNRTRSTPNLCNADQSFLPTRAVVPFHNSSACRIGNPIPQQPSSVSFESSTPDGQTSTTRELNAASSKSGNDALTANCRDENCGTVCWQRVADIPTNVAEFSVDELSRALELLQMPRMAEMFRDQLVDGSLLLEIATEESLITDFHCKVFEARKIIQFAKHNWRPKV